MEQNREYYDKEFTCQDSSITRGELESLPCPFCTKTYQPSNTMRTTSSQTYSQLLHNLDCRRGAPLGRPDVGTEDDAKGKRIYCRRVYLTCDGAYDKGGAYWGIGIPLYVKFTLDKSYVKFFRKE